MNYIILFYLFFPETLLGLTQTKFEVFYTWLVMTLDKYQLYMLCYTTSNEFILVDFFLGGPSINYVTIFRRVGRSKIDCT